MRAILLALLIASPITSVPAQAAADGGALAPGKPAGIRSAQLTRDPYLYVLFGAGLAGAGIAILESSGHMKLVTTATTTTSTSP